MGRETGVGRLSGRGFATGRCAGGGARAGCEGREGEQRREVLPLDRGDGRWGHRGCQGVSPAKASGCGCALVQCRHVRPGGRAHQTNRLKHNREGSRIPGTPQSVNEQSNAGYQP